MIFILIGVIFFVGIDQAIKFWVIDNLMGNEPRRFIKIGGKEIINLTYLENDGALFGSFGGMRWLLIGFTAVLITVCIIFLLKQYKKQPRILIWSLVLIISGGIGNFIDRLFRNGHVVDYLEVKLFKFAIFNFADCCVTIGTILLIIYIMFFENKKHNSECVKIKKGAVVKNE